MISAGPHAVCYDPDPESEYAAPSFSYMMIPEPTLKVRVRRNGSIHATTETRRTAWDTLGDDNPPPEHKHVAGVDRD
jgi:hypothetical protein